MYIFEAATYCEECGNILAAALKEEGREDTGDSGDFPQDCAGLDDSSDSPVHCDNCTLLIPTKLTQDGQEYVAQALIDNTGDCDVLEEWAAEFDLPYPSLNGWDEDAVRAWAENLGTAVEGLETFEDAFTGQFGDREHWAAEYVESCGLLDGVPESVKFYFSFEAYGRDAELGGDMTFIPARDGGVFAFYNH